MAAVCVEACSFFVLEKQVCDSVINESVKDVLQITYANIGSS